MRTIGLKTIGLKTIGLLLVGILALPGCGGDAASETGGRRVIVGIVATVEATSLVDVESFTVRSDGETFEILIDPDVTYAFPPEHLRAHAIGSEPVRVEVEERSDDLYALSIEDA